MGRGQAAADSGYGTADPDGRHGTLTPAAGLTRPSRALSPIRTVWARTNRPQPSAPDFHQVHRPAEAVRVAG